MVLENAETATSFGDMQTSKLFTNCRQVRSQHQLR